MVVITRDLKKKTTRPTQKTVVSLLVSILKVLVPTRYSFLDIISHELVKGRNCCTEGYV